MYLINLIMNIEIFTHLLLLKFFEITKKKSLKFYRK